MATAPTEIKVTPEIAAEHGVTSDEYARIKQILGRDPNITELGIFSVMWSEHCSYKSSKVHLKRLPTRGKLVVQGPGENAGVVDIGDGLVAAFKIESQNPLVNALALGIARKEDIFFAKAKGTGNPVIYVGATTGRDGIHGASLLASAEFTEESKQKRPNVQVGDPFMEKLLLEACLEAMQTGAVIAIQDMGAAGLTCSTTEMASRGGTGIEIDLAKVPQRESGMTSYEIMLSESQERMLLVAEKGREREVLDVFKKWGLDAVVVGRVTDGGLLRVKDQGKIAAEIPAHPLAEEGPVYRRPIAQPALRKETPADWFSFAPQGANLTENFKKLLGSPAIASKRWITEQYDTM